MTGISQLDILEIALQLMECVKINAAYQLFYHKTKHLCHITRLYTFIYYLMKHSLAISRN